MYILALEFSSHRRGVSVVQVEKEQPSRPLALIEDENYRMVTSMSLVDAAMTQAGIAPAQIDLIAVGLGPGSYTGIRSAIAISQGWQLARETKVAGIPTDELLAAQAWQAALRGEFMVAIDAQRNELYLAEFTADDKGAHRKTALAIRAVQDLPSDRLAVGPEVDKWFANARIIHPSAKTLAQLASRAEPIASAEFLEPIYLRPTNFVKAPPPRIDLR